MKLQNVTKGHGKWYDDACGTAFALELIGERWSLLIVRELLLGPRRFTDLRGGLPGVSAKVLSERLAGLESARILVRRQASPPATGQVYELTGLGYAAEDAVKALGRWAAQSPDHDPTLPLSNASLIMSLRTMYDAARADGVTLSGNLTVAGEDFFASVENGVLTTARGRADSPDFALDAPSAQLVAAAVYGKIGLDVMAEAGLSAAGDADAVLRFIDLFHLPQKIG